MQGFEKIKYQFPQTQQIYNLKGRNWAYIIEFSRLWQHIQTGSPIQNQ